MSTGAPVASVARMTRRSRGLLRGVGAGAAGTTALTTTTYLDMSLRGRGGSDTPERLVGAAARRAGVAVPGDGAERRNRVTALGTLSGTATGLAVGGVAGVLRRAGLRLPAAVGGPLLGLAAMAGADVPLAVLGVSDPRRWSTTDWVSDAVPHLVYGVTTHAALVAMDQPADPAELRRARSGLRRAACLGAASGGRSTAGVTAVALTTAPEEVPGVGAHVTGRAGTVLAALAAVGELVGDKSAAAPPRTEAVGLVGRLASGAGSAALVAQREDADPLVCAAVGAVTAAGTAQLGVAWRSWAADRFGSDRPGSLVEDAVVGGLAWWGARRR